MPLILRPALRNITRNPARTLLIFLMEAVIIALFFIGNSLLTESSQGLKRTYKDSFTGDGFIHVQEEIDISLFGAMTPSMGEFHTMREIPDPEGLERLLDEKAGVASYLPLLSGIAEVQIRGFRVISTVFGISPEEHFAFFPNLAPGSGKTWLNDEPGIMISSGLAADIGEKNGEAPKIGDLFLLTSQENLDFRIREVPLKGVFQAGDGSEILERLCLIDAPTMRELLQVSGAPGDGFEAGEETRSLLEMNIDDLFGGSGGSGAPVAPGASGALDNQKSPDAAAFPGDPDAAWHFYLLRFADGVNPRREINRLNRILEDRGLEAGNWQSAAGLSAVLVVLLRVIFNGGFILVVFAGTVAIVNLLTISVVERTDEIGTLRALGGGRDYVRVLLLVENTITSAAAAVSGVAGAGVLMALLNQRLISLDNQLLSSLFGGTWLTVTFGWNMAFLSVGIGVLLGLLSSIFPISMALHITPLQAMQRE